MNKGHASAQRINIPLCNRFVFSLYYEEDWTYTVSTGGSYGRKTSRLADNSFVVNFFKSDNVASNGH